MNLCVSHLRFGYAGREALLKDVSLTARGGEVLGVLGPNGSGKTTLVRLMTGALRPPEGTVTLDDRPVASLSPRELARALALVPQSSMPPEGFTALDVVLMGRHAHIPRFGREDARDLAIAEEAMARTGVKALAEQSVSLLSGGEWQRVLIARALAQTPRALFLDEPVSNLDIRYQLETLRLLRSLVREGLAVVLVMHDVNLAARFCDRLAVLSEGTLVAVGAPGDVLTGELLRRVYGVGGVVTHGEYPHFEPD